MEAALVHKNNPLYGMPLRAFDVEQFWYVSYISPREKDIILGRKPFVNKY
jgi:hypothetical protein